MSQSSFNTEVVRQCLRQLGARFRTKELAQHPLMVAGHQELVDRRNYNAMVGTYLTSHCPDVARIDSASNGGGALWSNRLCAEASGEQHRPAAKSDAGEAARAESAAGAGEADSQRARDNPFTARMRRHQSWYREAVLQLPAGTGPHASSLAVRGSMLRAEDAQHGSNFLTPEIQRVARDRLREGGRNVERFRLLHNMLSSQPMCFNLFGPLVRDLALATQVFQTQPELEVERVLAVKLELAPAPAEEYLADGTSFDAYVEYDHRDGSRAFVGIETKLTDGFSREVCDTPAYRRWMQGARAPWRPEAASSVADPAHNQLWRDHLLAIAMRDHPAQRYGHGALMLVRHPLDESGAAIARGYRKLLRRGDRSFIDAPMDQLVERWRAALGADERGAWLSSFSQRYLALADSESFRG
jgi:PD-(D/E)XK nuclease superfamily protein